MKKKIVIVCICLAVITLSFAALGSGEISVDMRLGQLFKNAKENSLEGQSSIAVEFRDISITTETVEYYMSTRPYITGQTQTEREIAQWLITNCLMLIEAEELGISATQEEIDDMVANTRRSYEIPDGKQMIDEYLAGAGISFEEYLEAIEDQAPNTITRQKLKDYYGQLWCEENGVEFTKVNPPQEMMDYIDEMLDGIYEKYESEIIYYIGDSLA